MSLNIIDNINLSSQSALGDKVSSIQNRYSNQKSSFSSAVNRENELKKLKNVSEEFESILINEMFKSMRKTINKADLVKVSMAENIFEDMLYTEYSKEFAKSNSLGVSKMIYDQMEKYI